MHTHVGELRSLDGRERGVHTGRWLVPATIADGGCDAYGNVGSDAIYHSGHVVWANPLGHIRSGTVGVRYVTRLRVAAMVKVAGLPYGMKWAFVPRSCLIP